MPVQGGIFGGLGFKPLDWPDPVVDNSIGSTPASNPDVFGTGGGGGLTSVYQNPPGYNLPGFGTPTSQGPGIFDTFGGVNRGGGFVNPMTGESVSTAIPSQPGTGTFDGNTIPTTTPEEQQQIDTNPGFTHLGPQDTPQVNQPDLNINQPDVSGGGGGGINSPDVSSTPDASGAGGTGAISGPDIAGGGGGQGMPINLGLQSSTTQFISGQSKQIEQSFGSEAQNILTSAQTAIGTLFAGVTDTFIRWVLILLGLLVIFIALWRILFPDEFKELAHALPALAKA